MVSNEREVREAIANLRKAVDFVFDLTKDTFHVEGSSDGDDVWGAFGSEIDTSIDELVSVIGIKEHQ